MNKYNSDLVHSSAAEGDGGSWYKTVENHCFKVTNVKEAFSHQGLYIFCQFGYILNQYCARYDPNL